MKNPSKFKIVVAKNLRRRKNTASMQEKENGSRICLKICTTKNDLVVMMLYDHIMMMYATRAPPPVPRRLPEAACRVRILFASECTARRAHCNSYGLTQKRFSSLENLQILTVWEVPVRKQTYHGASTLPPAQPGGLVAVEATACTCHRPLFWHPG